MITEENLNILYKRVIEGQKLTTKELNSYGFNSKDLKKLIEDNKLERIQKGLYRFIDSKTLYELGKQSISTKDFETGNLYFEKCYELDNNNVRALYSLFVQSIKNKTYDKTIKYYEQLVFSANDYYKKDYNTYIYLLNIITKLPQPHQEYAKNLKPEDLFLLTNEKRYKDVLTENKIRKAIFSKNLKFALKQLNDLTAQKQENTFYDIVLRTLIVDAIEKEKRDLEKTLELIKNKKYLEIINVLTKKEQKENLSSLEKYIIKLSKTIIYIKKNKELPQKSIDKPENIYEAIDGNNYNLALNFSIDNSKKYNLDNKDNAMYILLTEISNLIKELEETKKQQEELEKKKNIKITDIINYLIQNDIDSSLTTIHDYLTNKNQKEYELLITKLIKLSIIEKDITYSKAILVLINLDRNNYQFDVSKYIENFYIALSQNKFEEAKLYLDIINYAKNLGQNYNYIENLSNILSQVKENFDKKTLVNQVETPEEKAVKPNEKTIKHQTKTKEIVNAEKSQIEVIDSEIEFIKAKYNNLITDKGALLLKPMDKERRIRIYRILDNYKDVVKFSVGTSEPKQIVMRYKPYNEEYIDIKGLITSGNEAYIKADYDKCIECYIKILSFGKPKTFAYARLGLAYMKKFNINKAIEYLTIATNLSKVNNESFDFTELIDKLKGNNNEEIKPRFIMKEKDFENDLDDYYGIENFDELNNLILESYQDVESACEALNLQEEQQNRIKLLYAKFYYSHGQYEIGDTFITDVERTKNKSAFIKQQIEIIKNNKKFYINREKTMETKLSLTLKPKK